MEVPSQTVSKVADTVAATVRMGVEVELIDGILGENAMEREYQKSRSFEKKIEQLDRERKEAIRRLRKIDVEMVYKDYGIHTVLIIESVIRRPQ